MQFTCIFLALEGVEQVEHGGVADTPDLSPHTAAVPGWHKSRIPGDGVQPPGDAGQSLKIGGGDKGCMRSGGADRPGLRVSAERAVDEETQRKRHFLIKNHRQLGEASGKSNSAIQNGNSVSARRKRSRGPHQPVKRIARGDELILTRQDVASRELIEAVRQFFADGDPVVIHLLASAALDVITPIAKAGDKTTLQDITDERVDPLYLDSWRLVRKEAYNFFKHGGAKADDKLRTFRPIVNEAVLFEACTAFGTVFDDAPIEIKLFQFWFLARHPKILNEKGLQAPNPLVAQLQGLTEEQCRHHMAGLLAAAKHFRAELSKSM